VFVISHFATSQGQQAQCNALFDSINAQAMVMMAVD
jgi:hypothetical protein